MRNSLYWDDFERRTEETVKHMKDGTPPPVRRVACFITNACNFKCAYCNNKNIGATMTQEFFRSLVSRYAGTAIIHITGGEPSVVPWLYDAIRNYYDICRFHLNTNAFIMPPAEYVRRLKVSLDSHKPEYWNKLVGVRGAWQRVVKNIKACLDKTTVSITYTLTKENYKQALGFVNWYNKELPNAYAVFFSVYKGNNPRFIMDNDDCDEFFNIIYPRLLKVLDDESKALIQETIDEKYRIMQGIRFPQNLKGRMCFLSMSEKAYSPTGEQYRCSHLYRDRIHTTSTFTQERCKYGCNQRLVMFNERVQDELDKL